MLGPNRLGSVVVVGLALVCWASEALGFQEKYQPGERVVTVARAAVKQGTEVLVTVDAGTESVVSQINGQWIGVAIRRDSKQSTGWIHARLLTRGHGGPLWWLNTLAPAQADPLRQTFRTHLTGRLESEARVEAARLLGELRDPRAVEALQAAAKSDDPQFRAAAEAALTLIQNPPEPEPLFVPAERPPAPAVGDFVAPSGPPLDAAALDEAIAGLQSENPIQRRAAAETLGRSTDRRAVEPLVAAMKDPQWYVRVAAVRSLRAVGDVGALEPLAAALGDPQSRVRLAAVNALGDLGNRRAFDPLLAAMHDPEWDVRRAAVLALGRVDPGRALQPVADAARGDLDPHVRVAAVGVLQGMDDPRAANVLLKALKDADTPVRHAAASALAARKEPRAVEPLMDSLKDPLHAIPNAAEALAGIDDPRTLTPLIAALADPEPAVRRLAVETIDRWNARDAITPLAAHVMDWQLGPTVGRVLLNLGWHPQTEAEVLALLVCQRQRELLLAMWPQAQRTLLAAVEGIDEQRAGDALSALLWIDSARAIPDLLALLGRQRTPAVAKALLKSGRPELREAALAWALRNGYNIGPPGWIKL